MLIHRLMALPLATSLWTVTVPGQVPPSQGATPEKQAPVIRVVTELVELRVVVTDTKGHPITDLTREVMSEAGAGPLSGN